MAKTYYGFRCEMDASVYASSDGGLTLHRLPLRLDLRNHSPAGFQWGCGGSGPSQLALAMLADLLGNDQLALDNYQDLKASLVARIGVDVWEIQEEEIWQHVRTFIV